MITNESRKCVETVGYGYQVTFEWCHVTELQLLQQTNIIIAISEITALRPVF